MTTIDWIIVAAYAVLTVGVGLWANRSVVSLTDFVVAGRGVRLSLNVATLTSTELAIITVMALAEVGFRQGFSAMALGLCFFVGVTFVGATGFLIEGLRRCQVMTIPEFYGRRYGGAVRWFGGLVLGATGILNMGVFLKVSALFLTQISGLDSGKVGWVMAGVLAAVLIYTLLGGRLSVVYTNYFQFLLIVIGAMVATGFAVAMAGWRNMVAAVQVEHGLGGVNPFVHPDLGWSFLLLNILVSIAVPAVWQPAAACTLSAYSPQVARKTILWSGLTFMGRGTIPILWGIAALAYYHQRGGLPVEMKPIEAMPSFFAHILPVGVTGLFVAAMLATDMSTYNGYLLSWSSILTQDVLAPLARRPLRDRQLLFINRMLIFLIGAFLLWWGLIYQPPATFFQYMQVTGAIYLSGALVCVACGLYCRWVNSAGAFAAIGVGTVFPLLNVLFQPWMSQWPPWLQFLKNGWISGLLAYGLALLAMVIVSAVTLPWIKPRPLWTAVADEAADIPSK